MTPDAKTLLSFFDITKGQESDGDSARRCTSIDSSWTQGRSAFGGVSAGFGVNHLLSLCPERPRRMTARLWAPIPTGRLTSTAQALRTGKSLHIYRASLSTDEQTCGEVDVFFGAARESALNVAPPECPAWSLEDGRRLPSRGLGLPSFLQHMEIVWCDGALPYSGATSAEIGGFCRHRTAASGVAGIVGLLDAWPPTVLPLATRPVFASTVQMNIHLTHTDLQAGEWCVFQAHAVAAVEGYAATQANLWDSSGRHIAWMEQLVAVYG